MAGKRAVVAGHICLDITPVFPSNTGGDFSKIFSPGTLTNVEPAQLHTGGCVANTGLAMSFLGADVALMGKIGDDPLGATLQGLLEKKKARQRLQISPGSATSYSIVLAVPGSDRFFLHCPGANDTFSPEDLDYREIGEAQLFHFGYPPLMRRLYQDNGEGLWEIFSRVKEMGLTTSLDLASVDPNSPAGQADWKAILARVLPLVDFFVPSVEELCAMLDPQRLSQWKSRAQGQDVTLFLDVQRDILPLARQAVELGAKGVLLKCGAPGMFLLTQEKEEMGKVSLIEKEEEWANQCRFERSFRPQVVRSATGAGDVSIAAFLTALLMGAGPQECLELAAGTGASCVESYDAISGLRTFDQIREKIRAGWEKQTFPPQALNEGGDGEC